MNTGCVLDIEVKRLLDVLPNVPCIELLAVVDEVRFMLDVSL